MTVSPTANQALVSALLAAGCDTEARTEDILVPFGPPVP